MLVKAVTPPLFLNIGRGQITRHFWRHVRKTDSCWLFTSNHATGGYAYVRIGTARWRAHRFSWMLHFGPIPKGVWVLHTCDVPCCVNPQHLWLGSAVDNTADCIAKGRYRLPFHAVGEDNGRAILTPAIVR